MKKMQKLAGCIIAMMVMAGCNAVSDRTNNNTLDADASIPLGDTAVIFNSSFVDSIGNISTISLTFSDIPTAILARTLTDSSDAVVRSAGGKIYVINRYLADTIQVIDPATFEVIADYSVGHGSNPQDIAVISDDKAYVSRLDAQNDTENSDDIIIVNPLTGEKLGSIDLKPYTTDDGERLARAAQMVLVDNYLYVCMQDLPAFMGDPANTNGKVAIINIDTDELVDADPDIDGIQVIQLAGRNPSDITYSPANDRLYVADTGVYVNYIVDTSDANGGIEFIRLEDNKSEGIIIDDAALGGGVNLIRLASPELGFTIINSTTIASFNPKTYEVVSKNIYTTPGFYLPDFAIDSQDRILVAEQDFNAPGILFLNLDGTKIAGPISVGAPPSSITFVDVTK